LNVFKYQESIELWKDLKKSSINKNNNYTSNILLNKQNKSYMQELPKNSKLEMKIYLNSKTSMSRCLKCGNY